MTLLELFEGLSPIQHSMLFNLLSRLDDRHITIDIHGGVVTIHDIPDNPDASDSFKKARLFRQGAHRELPRLPKIITKPGQPDKPEPY